MPGWPALDALALREVDRDAAARLLPALRLPQLGARSWRTSSAAAPRPRRRGRRRRPAEPARRRARCRASYETVLDLDALRRLARAAARRAAGRARHRDRFARRRCARASSASRSRSSPARRPTCRWRTTTPARPTSCRCDEVLARAEALARGRRPRPRSARTSSTTSTCFANHGITVRGYAPRHAAARATCSRRTSRTAWRAWPSATSAARA